MDQKWSERKAVKSVHISAAVLRYQSVDKLIKDEPLTQAIRALAQQYSRMGLPMMILKLRQQGFTDNKKRIRRIYKQERLNLRTKKKKRIKVLEPHPLTRPVQINDTWSMDFVFDRMGHNYERMIKCLTIVDDASDEIVDIYTQLRIQGRDLVYILELLKVTRGLPKRIRTDNGKEFRSKALQAWAKQNNVELLFIQPGKPNQNAIIESFNGRFRDECLNQNQFLSLQEAQQTIHAWTQLFNTERPKKRLGGLTPVQYAANLTANQNIQNKTQKKPRPATQKTAQTLELSVALRAPSSSKVCNPAPL
jgi:transposase InsO family protein